MSKSNMTNGLFIEEDLTQVISPIDLSPLTNSCILITGASGFMGIWLTELLTHLIKAKQLQLKLLLLAPDFSFANKVAPHLYTEDKNVEIIYSDVRSLHELPTEVEWIIHAAASPDLRVHNSQPIYASRTISQGTLALLECATRLPRLKKLLNVSSGYVYGYHSVLSSITEKDFDGFDPSMFAVSYAEAKRYAESLCTVFRNQFRLPILNVRPFSFIGPYQSADAPWAVNNFINNVVHKQPIRIQGDGTAIRSYMYGADMAWWLLNILLRGEPGYDYNLGSTESISLQILAEKVRLLASSDVPINLGRSFIHSKKSTFVPSTALVQEKLGLTLQFSLDQALARTIQWYEKNQISR